MKIKHVLQHIGKIIKAEFSKNGQSTVNIHDKAELELSRTASNKEESSITNQKQSKKAVKEVINVGELSTHHILAKMNREPANLSQQINKNKMLVQKKKVNKGEKIIQQKVKNGANSKKVNVKIPEPADVIKQNSTQTMDDYKFVIDLPVDVNQKNNDNEYIQKTMIEIKEELTKALEHWKWTQKAFEQALGFEQVEYCIYQMMAAEQKYRMILLKARALQVEWSKVKGDLV